MTDNVPSDSSSKPKSTPKPTRKLSLKFNSFVRWAHIYLSMVGFLTMLFFSFTGITLNHPNWFGGETGRSSTLKDSLPLDWVNDTSSEPDRLKIAEHLRDKHRLRGMVKEFRTDDEECSITFKGPGYSADVFVDRKSGDYEIAMVQHGFIGVWNDLHKGRDSGTAWSLLIDVSAIIMMISGLTGLAMLFFLKRKRFSGLASVVVGGLLFLAVYFWLVP